jgi:hypothetical protein
LRATVTFSYDRYYVDRGTTKPVQTSDTTTQSPFNAGTAGLPSDSYTNTSIADYLRTPTFSPQEQQIIKSDPKLFFHFAYATWNGPGWFRKFANSIKREIRQGNTDTNSLFNIAIDDRKDAGGIIGAKADKVKAAAQF